MFIDLPLGALHEPLTDRRLDGPQALQHAAWRAALFESLGVGSGHKVFLHFGNRIEFFVDLLALWRLGACVVPVDARFTAFEIEQLVRAVRPTLSVWDVEPPAAVHSVLETYGVRRLGIEEAGATSQTLSNSTVFARGLFPRLDDAALLLFTSGTTGAPKGVVHTHRSLRARWIHQRERHGTDAFARTLCAVPTQFAWGLVGHCLYTWFSGQTLLLVPPYRQDILLRLGALCDEHAVTCLPSVPTMWKVALRTTPPPQRGSLLRVTSGTAALPPALWRGVAQWSQAEVLNIFGITETGWLAGASSAELVDDEPLVGEPWGAVIRVLESASTERPPSAWRVCAPGETGHLWVQTPALMAGYFQRDDLTQQVISDGWFSTGDLGALDAQGRLVLRGRHKELINVGGAKVYPADLDALIGAFEEVEDVCAFGIDDALQGESVAIALVLRDADEQALTCVYARTAAQLSQHQMPRRWYVVDSIPRTARAKLDRNAVATSCAAFSAIDQRTLEKNAAR